MAAIRINSPHAVARRSGDLTKLLQDYVESEAVYGDKDGRVDRARRRKNNDEFKDSFDPWFGNSE